MQFSHVVVMNYVLYTYLVFWLAGLKEDWACHISHHNTALLSVLFIQCMQVYESQNKMEG